ncbi:hypothetical protein MNBD_GAMMA02-224 [hydrothermal vent metagenome]|uniref:Uncharacterized protein n=1 Tax=hydrothermal vent metagenome TaxID=652676 RepID=A0A3B0W2U7_9ZZZZ
MATGKIDAVVCFVGLFIGTWVFMLSFGWIEAIYNQNQLGSEKLHELWSVEFGTVTAALVIAAVLVFYLLENRFLFTAKKKIKP